MLTMQYGIGLEWGVQSLIGLPNHCLSDHTQLFPLHCSKAVFDFVRTVLVKPKVIVYSYVISIVCFLYFDKRS